MDLDHRGGRVGQVEPPRFGAGGVVGQLGGALWSDDRLQGECPDGAVPHPGDDVVIGVLPFFHIYGMNTIMNLTLYRRGTLVTMPKMELPTFLDLVQSLSLPSLSGHLR